MKKAALLFLLAIPFFLVSCVNQNNENRTEREFSDLREWWNENTRDISNSTSEEWQEFKADYKSWRDSLRREDLTAEERAEYDKMDRDVETWDNDFTNRQARQDNTNVDTGEIRMTLLGDTDPASVTATGLRQAYLSFMERVRERNDDWSEPQWDAAEATFDELQQARERLSDQISTTDKAKIAALETEFRALETAGDVEESVSR